MTYVDVSFDAPLQLRQGISFAVYGGDTPAGQLVFLCEDCRDRISGAECCTRTLRPLRIFCGRVLTRHEPPEHNCKCALDGGTRARK